MLSWSCGRGRATEETCRRESGAFRERDSVTTCKEKVEEEATSRGVFFFFLMSDNGGRELAENMMSTDWTQAGVGLD